MNIILKLKLLLTLKKPASNLIQEVNKMKDGYKTTEFWLTILTNLITIVTAIQGVIPPQTAAIILAVLNGIYTTMRSIVKINAPDTTPAAPPQS